MNADATHALNIGDHIRTPYAYKRINAITIQYVKSKGFHNFSGKIVDIQPKYVQFDDGVNGMLFADISDIARCQSCDSAEFYIEVSKLEFDRFIIAYQDKHNTKLYSHVCMIVDPPLRMLYDFSDGMIDPPDDKLIAACAIDAFKFYIVRSVCEKEAL